MAITLNTGARDAACDAITALVDVNQPGTLELYHTAASTTSGVNEVATLTFASTAFNPSSSGTCAAAAIVSDTNATGLDLTGVDFTADPLTWQLVDETEKVVVESINVDQSINLGGNFSFPQFKFIDFAKDSAGILYTSVKGDSSSDSSSSSNSSNSNSSGDGSNNQSAKEKFKSSAEKRSTSAKGYGTASAENADDLT